MNKIEQIDELLTQHLQTDGVRPEDREVMVKLQQLAKEYLEDNKTMDTEGTEQTKPGTVYETKLASMSIAEMANLGVKLISVNNDSLFWVTSFGQMYKFDERGKAFEAEYLWLMSKVT